MTTHARFDGLIYRMLICVFPLLILAQPALAQRHRPATLDGLIKNLRSPNVSLRLIAVLDIGRMGSVAKAATTPLTDLMKDEKNGPIRRQIITTLGLIDADTEEAANAIAIALQDLSDEEIRIRAADSLGWIVNAERPQMLRTLNPLTESVNNDPSAEVRQRAAYALGEIGAAAKEAVPALVAALGSFDQTLRLRAANALQSIGADTEETIDQFILRIQKDDDDEVRAVVARALGKIGGRAKRAIPFLVKALSDRNPEVRAASAEGLDAIIDSLADAKDVGAIQILRLAHGSLPQNQTTEVNQARGAVERGILILESHELWLPAYVHEQPVISSIMITYATLLLTWLMLLWLRPLWLLRANEALVPVTEIALPLPKPFDVIKLPFRHFILLGFFHYHSRVLDAWVAKYLPKARETYARMATVSERRVFVQVPVVLEGQTLPGFTAADSQPLLAGNIFHLLISGEGGSGKTSLACEFGRWGMAGERQKGLCETHHMLPILVEHELAVQDWDDGPPLLHTIRTQLRILIEEVDSLPLALVRHLLKRRRLLLIVDSLSEMSTASRASIISSITEIPVNAAIFTSRTDENMGDIQPKKITPVRIKGDNLSKFMSDYLERLGKRHLFKDTEFFDACGKLSSMVGDRDVTALLAKSFAEQLVAKKEGLTTDLPGNIPDLMLNYINLLSRRPEPDIPETKIVVVAAKALAWACLKKNLRPNSISYKASLAALMRSDVKGELCGLGFPNMFADVSKRRLLLNYLDVNLRIIKTRGTGVECVSFTLDPLSEYLASLRILARYRDRHRAWHLFLQKVRSRKSDPITIRGFLLALRDCCQSNGAQYKVPGFVITELENLLSPRRDRSPAAPR